MPNPLSFIHSVIYRLGHFIRHCRSPETWRRFRIAARRYDCSLAQILVRTIQLYWLGRFLPEESLSKGLLDPLRPLDEHRKHFSEEPLHGLQLAINSSHAAMCRDKLLFHAYCRLQGLPVSGLLGVVSTFGSRGQSGRMLHHQRDWLDFVQNDLPPDFIAKPRGGNQGGGAPSGRGSATVSG